MLADFKIRRRTTAPPEPPAPVPEPAAPPAPVSAPGVQLAAPVTMADCWQHIGVWGNGSCGELTAHLHCRNCPTYTTAALRLLDARPPAGYRQEWTAHLAERVFEKA